MKKTGIFTCIMMLLFLVGCSGMNQNISNAAPIADAEPKIEEPEEEKENITEDETPEEEVNTDKGQFMMEVCYHFNVINLKPEAISVGIGTRGEGDENEYINSGFIFVDDAFEYKDNPSYSIPLLSCEDKKIDNLSQEDMDELRSVLTEFYSDNLADGEQDVIDKFVEIANNYSLWKDSSMKVDYQDKMKKDFQLQADESVFPMHAKTCEIKYPFSKDVGGLSDSIAINCFEQNGHMRCLSSFVLEYYGTMENVSTFRKYLRDKYDSYGSEEDSNESAATEDEDIISSDENDDGNAKDTGIVGKWYPDYTDYSTYFIQIDEGGVGEIHQDNTVYKITYTFSNNTVYVSVPSTGGTNEFYYEDGVLVSDFTGDVYRKEQPKKEKEKPISTTFDITGTWYDPTGYSPGGYIFNEDGTGTQVWEFGRNNSAPMTYEVSGNTVIIHLSNLDYNLSITGSKLSDGESLYVKR